MFDHARTFGVEEEKADSVGATLKKFGRYYKSYWLALILVAVALIGSVYMQVQIPFLIGQGIDCYLTPYITQQTLNDAGGADMAAFAQFMPDSAKSDIGGNCSIAEANPDATFDETLAAFTKLILLIAALYIGNAVLGGVMFFTMSWAGFHVLRDMRADIFQHIHKLSLGYFNQQEAGEIMSRVTNDMDTIQQVMGFGLVQVMQSGLLIVWVIYKMFSLSPVYALLSLVTLPFMFIATRWFSTQARKAFRQARREIGSVNADLQENIAAVREVQAFSREEENIDQFRLNNAANRDANIKAQAFTSALAPTLEGFGYVSLAVVSVVGGLMILNDWTLLGATVSIGLVITFIGYSQQFNRPVQQISVLWTNIQSAIAGGERVFNFLAVPPDLTDKPNAPPMPEIQGDVKFSNVWAEYEPGAPVLKGINIAARPGETIAIVGPTGAGKTTIINLLPRFMDVSQGAVTIDGIDVRDVQQRSLRQQIGLVLQDTFLFSDTVLNNIRYGRPEASAEEVIEAAKLARAHDFISRLPDGYNTVLGERGGGLSQGQRQLLAIARVALIDPRILILDEATSSVDTRTEREIQAAFEKLLHGRTSFVIAHRLSTIRHADQVLALNDGQIVERGTHQELLAAKGFYYDLYMSQFRRQEREEVKV